MVYGKKQLILAFVLTVLAGSGLHFVYGLCPNGVTALFSPVNESIWEHGKILFWPYLAAAVWLTWGRPTGLRPWLLVGVGICLLMFGIGYLLHVVLGWDSLAADLVYCDRPRPRVFMACGNQDPLVQANRYLADRMRGDYDFEPYHADERWEKVRK